MYKKNFEIQQYRMHIESYIVKIIYKFFIIEISYKIYF